jgi:enoyl-CoA hydratase/carnithine racemase
MLSMYHDYRIFNPSRGFLCLNEIQFGATLKPAMSSIFREKLPSPITYRSLVLEAHRFNAKEAFEQGIVDGKGAWPEVEALIEERKLTALAGSGVYGQLRREMFRQTYAILQNCGNDEAEAIAEQELEDKRKGEGKKRFQEWNVTQNKVAKL